MKYIKCKACEKYKPVDNYHVRRSAKSGRESTCKKCLKNRLSANKWRKFWKAFWNKGKPEAAARNKAYYEKNKDELKVKKHPYTKLMKL